MKWIGRLIYFWESRKKKWLSCYMADRHLARFKQTGRCIRLNGVSTIRGHDRIELGDNVHIGDNAYIVGDGGLFIGNNVHISRNLVLYTSSHNYRGDRLPYDETNIDKSVYIGPNVWIGTNVTILPGTHIEEGCIVGAGAVVAGRLERLGIYGAASAQKIGERNVGHYETLKAKEWYGGINGYELSQDCH
jgi:acetyltransferase-like isoleucine patch superfamily enzyme